MILFHFFGVELLGVPVSCIIVLSFDNGIACIKPFVDEDEVYAAAGSLCGDFCDLLSVGGGVYLDAVLLDGVGLAVGGFIGGGSIGCGCIRCGSIGGSNIGGCGSVR